MDLKLVKVQDILKKVDCSGKDLKTFLLKKVPYSEPFLIIAII